jgi:hypothetical protein
MGAPGSVSCILIYFFLFLVIVGPLVVIATRIRPDRTQPAYLLALLVVVAGGIALVSHMTNQLERDYLTVPLGLLGGLVLGSIIRKVRSHCSSRRLELASVFYIVAFISVSLTMDWFDPRGVIPCGILLMLALLRPFPPFEGTKVVRSDSDPISVNAAVAFLVGAAIALVWMQYGGSSGDELL